MIRPLRLGPVAALLSSATACVAILAGCGPGEAEESTAPSDSGALDSGEAPGDEPELPQGPEGTVFFVDDLPITEAEIDRLASAVERLYPNYTTNHARRIALAEYTLPRLAVAAAYPGERKAVLEACERARAEIDGELSEAWLAEHGARRFDVKGHWKKIGGVDLWTLAHELEEGEWSEPLERVGTFNLVRRGPITSTGETLHHEVLELSILTFAYLPEGDALALADQAMDRARLRITDPKWEEIVPEEFKYRMRGR